MCEITWNIKLENKILINYCVSFINEICWSFNHEFIYLYVYYWTGNNCEVWRYFDSNFTIGFKFSVLKKIMGNEIFKILDRKYYSITRIFYREFIFFFSWFFNCCLIILIYFNHPQFLICYKEHDIFILDIMQTIFDEYLLAMNH